MVSNPSADQAKTSNADKKGQKSVATTDVQSYLISRYREALKSGDKSFAKSCLLSTRLFSVNDPNITNEIYAMAKSDGDVGEAAKCFANIFQDLFANETDNLAHESITVANQMKEEMRLLLNELKTQYLKLKSTPNSTSSLRQQAPSVCQSPLLSPRSRMSSEDRSMSRDSVLKLDNHLNYTNKSFFYQQLFDNLPQDVRRNVLSHAIDSSDNPFERCRLMMLTIILFNDSVSIFGPRLLKTLMDLSELTSDKPGNSEKILGTTRLPSMCQYARSMLVLDAIPIVFNLSESQNLDFDLNELFQRIISYYSEFCLENVASEYEFEELHEGVKKTIAARILAKEMSSSLDDSIEENLILSMKLLFDKFIHVFSDDSITVEKLTNLRQLVTCKHSKKSITFQQMKELIASLELDPDIPESILFSLVKEETFSGSQTTTATPPPKSRGRPKKVQPTVIVSPDDGIRRHLQNKAREALFVFVTVLQYMFSNCSQYLRQTRSRILINFDNPLATSIESEILKSQRSSRSKNYSTDTGASPSKRLKTDAKVHTSNNDAANVIVDQLSYFKDSPLNSESSKKMDQEILKTLEEVHDCMEFLTTSSITFSKLWQRFLTSNQRDDLKWVHRIQADCLIISNQFESAIGVLNKVVDNNLDEPKIKKEGTDSELSTLTLSTGTLPSVEVFHLRALAQLISCYIQIQNKEKALKSIDELMGKIKQSGLLTNDENYSSGNIIDEYRMIIISETDNNKAIGFLFFDSLSLIRYVVDELMDILKRYVMHPNPTSDAAIGHTIVLSQIDWPKESQIYDRCIAWIRASKPISTTPQCMSALTKFTYTDFFHYIVDPNILEDFMALLNDGFTLDIKDPNVASISSSGGSAAHLNISATSSRSSVASSARSGKAITTRGVNKTFKGDLKVALIAQMKNSSNFMPLNLISEFIQNSLVPFLSSSN